MNSYNFSELMRAVEEHPAIHTSHKIEIFIAEGHLIDDLRQYGTIWMFPELFEGCYHAEINLSALSESEFFLLKCKFPTVTFKEIKQ